MQLQAWNEHLRTPLLSGTLSTTMTSALRFIRDAWCKRSFHARSGCSYSIHLTWRQ